MRTSIFSTIRRSGSLRGLVGTLIPSPALFLLVACGAEPPPTPTAVVRDSAGVFIVENQGTAPVGSGTWSLAVEPRVVIGSFAGPEEAQLYQVRGGSILSDGRIAVANNGTREVKVFSANGAFLRSFGGAGEGPGEFEAVLLAGLQGESMVLLDRRLGRVSFVHPERGFETSFSMAEGVASYPMDGWFLQSGSVLIRDLPLDQESVLTDGFSRTPVPLRSCDMSGAPHVDFGAVPGAEQVSVTGQTDHGLVTRLMSVPFGKSPQIAVAGDRVYLGTQDSFEVKVFGSDGALLRIVRLDRSPVPVTGADFQAFIDEEVSGIPDTDEALERRRELEEMPQAELMPAHGQIFADGAGYLFVAEFEAPEAEAAGVDVFDPEGRWAGHFQIPAGLTVLDVGEDYLLGLQQDDLGVETLRLYDFIRPS